MNTYRSFKQIALLLLTLFVAGEPNLWAQPAEPAAPTEPTSGSIAAPKKEEAKPEPAKENAVPPEPPAPAPAPTEPTPPAAPTEDVSTADVEKKAEPPAAVVAEEKANVEPTEKPHRSKNSRNRSQHQNDARVRFGSDSTLEAGEHADAVVSILGSSTSAGDVGDAVVSILGSSTSSGNVGDAVVSILGNTQVTGGSVGNAAVSVLGNTRITDGTIGDAAVSVLGNTYVNGHVKNNVVAVLGNVELGPKAVVGGEIVCVGGEVKRDPQAVVHGHVQHVPFGGFGWATTWIQKCFLYARPLAFDAHLMWAWWIALACLGIYALVALAVPNGVNKCVQTLEERPGYSIISAVLTMLLTPVAFVLLALTLALLIGFLLIPLFSLGLFFASLFGKVVILAWLGRRITKLFGESPISHPFFGVLIGGVIVLGLYTVPVVGFIVYKLIGLLGLGVVLYTVILSMKSRRPAVPPPVATSPVPTYAAAAPAVLETSSGPASAAMALPPVISAATLPRAGFWLRLAASLLDLIMVALVFSVVKKLLFGLGGAMPLWFAIYHVVMWQLKGTTIGGVICGLRVVRIDDRPLDWSVAIVRGLSAFLSFAVVGLGFIWVAFDDDKQSWHDKIAGTTIVKVPKGTPLL